MIRINPDFITLKHIARENEQGLLVQDWITENA